MIKPPNPAPHRMQFYNNRLERRKGPVVGMLGVCLAEILGILGVDQLDDPLRVCLTLCSVSIPLLVAALAEVFLREFPVNDEEHALRKRAAKGIFTVGIVSAYFSLCALLWHFDRWWIALSFVISALVALYFVETSPPPAPTDQSVVTPPQPEKS